jgi:hypothetical protein
MKRNSAARSSESDLIPVSPLLPLYLKRAGEGGAESPSQEKEGLGVRSTFDLMETGQADLGDHPEIADE